MASRLARHDLACVDPDAWSATLASRPDLDGVPHVTGWAEAGLPLIVRRYGPGEPRDLVPLGLPLPPADGKRRIGFALPESALTFRPAPTLSDVRTVAPPSWQPSLDALVALGDRLGLTPRPFGSLLWQALTGLEYLTDRSDLDLLWPVTAPVPVALLDGLAAIAASAPMRVDGEVLLPDGAGIQWRELREAPGSGDVLAKYCDRLEWIPAAALREEAAA